MISSRLLAAALWLASGAAGAIDFRSVGNTPVILYDAPSQKGGKLFVAPRGMPVEVVMSYGDWVKVRDASGDLAWTETKGLSARRSVIVRSPGARVRAAADDSATAVMAVDKGVLLDLVEPQAKGWVRVRHRDGIAGFIKASDVWGI